MRSSCECRHNRWGRHKCFIEVERFAGVNRGSLQSSSSFLERVWYWRCRNPIEFRSTFSTLNAITDIRNSPVTNFLLD